MKTEVSLPPKLQELIRGRMETGMYGSPTEVVEEALLLLESYDQLRAIREESLRKAIQEGLDSGPPIPAEEVFAELYREFQVTAE